MALVCLHVQIEVCTVSKASGSLNYLLPPSVSGLGAGRSAGSTRAARPGSAPRPAPRARSESARRGN